MMMNALQHYNCIHRYLNTFEDTNEPNELVTQIIWKETQVKYYSPTFSILSYTLNYMILHGSTMYHPHKRPKCISGTSHHPAAREFHGECHVQKAANSSKVDLAIYPPGRSTKVWKKPAIIETILRSGFNRKFTTNKSKSINIQPISFDSDPDNRTIVYDSSFDPRPPHIQSMLWPHRRCECLSSAMTVVANSWLKCASVIGGSYFTLQACPQVMVAIWTSFIDSSLHISRVQSTMSYSKAVSDQQKKLYFMEYPSSTEVARGMPSYTKW